MKSCSKARLAGFQSHQPARDGRVSSKSLDFKRAVDPHPVQYPGHELLVAAALPADLTILERLHSAQREAVIAHRQVGGGVVPMLEYLALPLQSVEKAGR